MSTFRFLLYLGFLSLATGLFATETDPSDDFVIGDPAIESISGLAFGPDGILFIGDSQSARVIAIKTDDSDQRESSKPLKLSQVDLQLGATLGVSPENFSITDMSIHPLSGNAYFGVELLDGRPWLIRYNGENFQVVDHGHIAYSVIELNQPVEIDAKDGRGRSLRKWSISDLQYYKGQVLVSGLSNEEFSSSLRSIPFPFSDNQMVASIEIYHAAHGQYETHSPVKTFMPYRLQGEDYIVASYTCTPLVIFPMDKLMPGQHTKGQTVAELGNRNTPLDIVGYKKDGKPFLLLANSSRALMKIDPEKIATFDEYLTTPVEESSATAGVDFLALPYTNVLQMDKISDDQIVLLIRKSNGNLDLETVSSSRL